MDLCGRNCSYVGRRARKPISHIEISVVFLCVAEPEIHPPALWQISQLCLCARHAGVYLYVWDGETKERYGGRNMLLRDEKERWEACRSYNARLLVLGCVDVHVENPKVVCVRVCVWDGVAHQHIQDCLHQSSQQNHAKPWGRIKNRGSLTLRQTLHRTHSAELTD